jgi:prepilin-type N-terminal cleavage/methylation domain-containing protein
MMQQPGNGFTLIELSIVLVIIGLIVGSVLVGQDLIRAAEVRAQMAQIEKYQTAVNTFRGKYNALPGDLNATVAAQFGFAVRGSNAGEGDGNGLIEGVSGPVPGNGCGECVFNGETAMVWADLSHANLIDGSFTASSAVYTFANFSGTTIGLYFPEAKLSHGNYIYVDSGGWKLWQTGVTDGVNYFALSAVIADQGGYAISNTTLTVQQAYAIDNKMDDGLPQTGRVTAQYLSGNCLWASGGPSDLYGETVCGAQDAAGGPVTTGDGVATPSTATTCYDNGGVAGAQEHYSIQTNSGIGANCALSFQFQ